MLRSARRSARLATSVSSSTTPTTARSPIFSTNPSVQSTTPETSEDEASKRSKRSRRTAAVKGKKRQLHDNDSDAPEEPPAKRPARRKSVTHKAFVEVRTLKAAEKILPSVDGEDELIAPSEDELDYDEKASLAESEGSGSEFEVSDAEAAASESETELQAYAEALEEEGIDADDVLLGAAVKASLADALRQDASNSGSGPSSNKKKPATAREVLRAAAAAAAKRRLTKSSGESIDVDDYLQESEDEYSDQSDISEASLPPTKGKGKGKAKAAKTKAVAVRPAPVIMTVADIKARNRQKRAEAKVRRQEERALQKKLGRKLTRAEKSKILLEKHHPELKDVWDDAARTAPIGAPVKAAQPPDLKVTLLPFQQESLHWFKEQEQTVWRGGMLADEMGMGKTIQMIALLVSDGGAKPNLVVAPTVAIMQWRNEIDAHSTGLDVLVWHGAARENNIKALKKFDVVLTTYAVLESCFRKQQSGFKRKGLIVKEKSVLHQVEWNRIILDEAHNIKERSTNTAKAAFELKANYRWCLSGTPLQNRVGELYSLVRFLGGDPFSYYFCKQCDCKSLHWKFSDKRSCDDCGHSPMYHTCFWNNEILTPIQKHGLEGPGRDAFKKLRILLDRMMLRRTKIERADDLGLPPRTVIVRRDHFSPEEKELYLSLFSDAKRQFNTFVDSGTVLNNYSNIFSLLTRMRQMACHPDLVLRSKNNAGTFSTENVGEATVCRLCNDIAEDAIQAKCRHIFDRECIKQYLNTAIEQTPACPVCHVPLTIDLEAPALELEENVKTRQGILGRLDLDKWRSSSKIEALIEELSNLRRQDATTKSLVFSQFVNFLDLIAYRLQKSGFTICRLEGTMSPQARDATIKYFMNNTHVTVFLVSLKAGGVALNLTEASRVYLMDSWWNPAVEFQAMDRIHRLGQRRPVQAIKLVIEDSIESRIVQLQEKKSAMVDATLSTDDSAMGRLTPEDLGFLFRL